MALVPLDSLRAQLGLNPWLFWGMESAAYAPVTSNCNGLVRQYGYQSALAVGRAEMAEALQIAEDKIHSYLGYNVGPLYHEETVPWPKVFDAELVRRYDYDPRGQHIGLRLKRGYIQAIGKETYTLIGTATVAGGTLVYSDNDGDGLEDAFTITLPSGVTDADEVGVYFAATDRFDASGVSERWRIAPARVTLSGGVATVRGAKWLCVRPVLYEGYAANAPGLSPTDTATFATSLDLYQRSADPNGETVDTAQATLLWETLPWPQWCWTFNAAQVSYTPNIADPAAVGKAVARVGIRDALMGEVTPAQAVRDATTGEWRETMWGTWYEPDRVTVRYRAGLPLVNGAIDSLWSETVARMAIAEIAGPICACENLNKRYERWHFDVARSSGAADESYTLMSGEDLSNPFGTRRGHIEAWQRVRSLRNYAGLAF